MPEIPVVDDAMHMAATPLDTRLRVAGMAEIAGMDMTIRPKRISRILDFLNELYPHIAADIALDQVQSWAGLRPISADGLPFIGQTKIKGLWLNTGHGHLGWTMAVGSAKLLADQFEGKIAEIKADPYRATR